MKVDHALREALLAAGCCPDVAASGDLSGGCIHRVQRLDLADGTTVVAKSNRADVAALFAEEARGLEALAATGTVLVPRPLVTGAYDGRAVLLLEWIAPGPAGPASWSALGRDLAALHAADAGLRYGFDGDNHLGTTPQPNDWTDDWVTFNQVHRLGFQVRRAREASRLSAAEVRRLERVIDRLDRILPRQPKPSLLHGDLWSGNALPAASGRIALIDPACSIGDGWADIAMMRLFGGFDRACFDAYRSGRGEEAEPAERIAAYQLYHVLNHVNLFGRGYAGQAMALAGALGG